MTARMDRLKEAIYAFLEQEGKEYPRSWVFDRLDGPRARQHPNLGALYVFDGPIGEFWVTERGNVITYNAPDRMSAKDAQAYVQSFLRRHIDAFEERNFMCVRSHFADPLWKEEWREEPREEEVAIFENWVVVQVNVETRDLHYFNRSDLRHVRRSSPALDEAAAREKIRNRNPSCEIEEVRLVEHTSDGGETWTTIWHAKLQPDDPEAPQELYSINADTGEVVP